MKGWHLVASKGKGSCTARPEMNGSRKRNEEKTGWPARMGRRALPETLAWDEKLANVAGFEQA